MTTRPPWLFAALAALALVAGATGCGADESGTSDPEVAAVSPPPTASTRGRSVLRGPIELLRGGTLPAADLRGRVVLVVNTASKCGFTPQFEGLEALSETKDAAGLTVVGFPSDDFAQELGDDEAIASFCELNYGVRFPMASPGRVTAPGAQPIFAAIAAQPGDAGRQPDWNFTKYLLDREGRLVARYESSVEPDDPRITQTLDRLLAEPADL